ncbi:dnaJ homolog subfamily C member 5 [Strongylocentrotus purpuratus]|uniref:J domain-containing protein n=1 Tax=Strongylocentrotus purpuratus TaxID=7668 RepID=A0A7M7PEC4_STRPU|nr:dnaJ homolog subfamily C member 5 [Strongylocentrotus purpuratus]
MASPMSKESRSMSTAGESLYQLLNVPKDAKEDDIKKAYRKMALKYHPDKNRDDPLAGERFKEINRAHKVLNDEKKRQIYDEYGSFGIYIADQIGEDNVDLYFLVNSKCFRVTSVICFFCTCYCFCFCCFLCCFGCCGRCKRGEEDDEDFEIVIPDGEDDEDEEQDADGNTPITSQPTASPADEGAANQNVAIPMPAPEKSPEKEPTEKTILNPGEKAKYTEG